MFKANRNAILIGVLALVAGVLIGQAGLAGAIGAADTPEPGAEADPVITLSYVENVLRDDLRDELEEVITAEIEDRLGGLDQIDDLDDLARSEMEAFEVVEVAEGETITGGASTEMILRAGRGDAVVSPAGGIADLTGGVDLGQGEAIPANHHLLIARDDGRGIAVRADAVIMVRGSYTIESGE